MWYDEYMDCVDFLVLNAVLTSMALMKLYWQSPVTPLVNPVRYWYV